MIFRTTRLASATTMRMRFPPAGARKPRPRPPVDSVPDPDHANDLLRLAREAGEAGGSYPAVLSAADEVAVEAFLQGRLRFSDIPRVLERCLEAHEALPIGSLAEVRAAEEWGRARARQLVEQA